MKSVFYERLFQLNRCLEQVCDMLDMYELDGVIHPAYAGVRKRTIEGLRADLSHVLTGMLHLKELEACVPGVFPKAGAKATDDDQAMP